MYSMECIYLYRYIKVKFIETISSHAFFGREHALQNAMMDARLLLRSHLLAFLLSRIACPCGENASNKTAARMSRLFWRRSVFIH